MRLGYNTNGFAFHRLDDAIDILHELGYEAVALTLDVHHLDPFAANAEAEAARIGEKLKNLGMACVVETGARFLLDPRRKHQPTLVSPTKEERLRRLRFLRRAGELGKLLGAECVSFWSGAAASGEGTQPTERTRRKRLLLDLWVLGLVVLDEDVNNPVPMVWHAEPPFALEPEPGMFVDTVASAMVLLEQKHVSLDSIGLAIDIGHLHCQREGDIGEILKSCGKRLLTVHLDDARRDVHDHLQLGEGEIDFVQVARALKEMDFQGVASVELSRHAHDAVNAARTAIARWREAEAAA